MVVLFHTLYRQLTLVLLVAQLAAAATVTKTPAKRSYSTHNYYVVQLHPSPSVSINECAAELDLEIVEPVGELADHWLVRVPTSPTVDKRDEGSASAIDTVLERFNALRRISSSPLEGRSISAHASERRRRIARSIRSLERQIPRQRTKKRAPIPESLPPVLSRSNTEGERAPVPPGGKSKVIAQELNILDPIFNDQWHLANNPYPNFDLNVSGVWKQGITGKGVYTAVVDDGLDLNSDDLNANFYAEGSWDYNDHTNLPLPRLADDQHGTRCSGEIAAVKNDVCGLGVAYESKISGIRILSGAISDADEAAALNYGYNVTSIYSCSWGPPDDGRSMEAPNLLIRKAVLNGIQNGRQGKGSIFVFASGNGAGSGDQCNFDGYTNSIYSVTVAAVDHMGKHPYYSEACAANLIVAYSSGGGNRIYTTDVGKNKCTSSHGGTSAAAPLGAGVIALGLQARPELTWRDVQYICIESAQHINPEDPDWEATASGRSYSYKYGYGALDAWTFVELAKTWKLVKKQAWVEVPQVEIPGSAITREGVMTGGTFIGAGGVHSSVTVNKTMLESNNFERLEHITVQVWISHARRGDVEVEIISPKGIKSVLAGVRRFDDHTTGYPGWKFMSVKHWGEDPIGEWKLNVKDQGVEGSNGSFLGWTLMLWGECIDNNKAKLYTLPEDIADDDAAKLPPSASATLSLTTTTSATARPKPTEGLPDDHDLAHGDTENPAFPNQPPVSSSTTTPAPSTDSTSTSTTSTASTTPTATPSVTPDEGYFDHIGDLLNSSTWLIAALVLTAIFAIAGGLFFWRRRVRRMADYSGLSGTSGGAGGDTMAMGAVDGSSRRLLGGGSKTGGRRAAGELYDALGEVSDDDEDEFAPSASHDHPGLRYHDEFLEDDQPDSAAQSPRMGTYRDEDAEGLPPREEGQQHAKTRALLDVSSTEKSDVRSSSPSGGSGDSWEHASTDNTR